MRKAEVLKLVHGHVTHVLLVAQASLPSSQFQAFRTVVLNEFGRRTAIGLDGLCILCGLISSSGLLPCTCWEPSTLTAKSLCSMNGS